jgi:hypothetical protein
MPDAATRSPWRSWSTRTPPGTAPVLPGETELAVVTCASGEAPVEPLRRHGDAGVRPLTTATLTGETDGHRLATAAGALRPGIRVVPGTGTPEACRGRVPGTAVCTRRPWLPLDVPVQAHAAPRGPRRPYAAMTGTSQPAYRPPAMHRVATPKPW